MGIDVIDIIKRLKEAVIKSGKSYEQLSKETGIPKSTLHRWTSGEVKRIPIDDLQIVADACHVQAEWIMGWTPLSEQLTLGLFGEEHPIINEIVDDLLLLDDEEIYEIKGYVKSVKNRKDRG